MATFKILPGSFHKTTTSSSRICAIFLTTSLLVILSNVGFVSGHGRLIEPPSRSTMWRYGFQTKPNYNDHELYCGGFTRQWRTNGGKCGICGDPWDSKQPRDNEAGGMYGKGVLVRRYVRGQPIKVRVELTANHMGYFEFRICPNNNPAQVASQRCLDQNLLKKTSGGGPRYMVGPGNKIFEMHYQLPSDLTCQQCVFQWRYIAGNNWGTCRNGTGAVGCGPQEEFRACADVAITDADGTADNTLNTLFDPEVYVPTTPEDEDYNAVDFNLIDGDDLGDNEYAKQGDKADDGKTGVVNVVLIVILTAVIVLMFFTGVYLYYMRGGKQYAKEFKDRHGFVVPSMPSMPSPPPKMLPKNWNWPSLPTGVISLSPTNKDFFKNNRLAKFLTLGQNDKPAHQVTPHPVAAASVKPTAKINPMATPVNPPTTRNFGKAAPAPLPPPRLKRSSGAAPSSEPQSMSVKTGDGASVTRLATVAPRGGGAPKLTAPAPPQVTPPKAPLEIGAPTSVTINGVSVSTGSPGGSGDASTSAAAAPLSGFVDVTTLSGARSLSPPPLPKCPPPEDSDFDEVNLESAA